MGLTVVVLACLIGLAQSMAGCPAGKNMVYQCNAARTESEASAFQLVPANLYEALKDCILKGRQHCAEFVLESDLNDEQLKAVASQPCVPVCVDLWAPAVVRRLLKSPPGTYGPSGQSVISTYGGDLADQLGVFPPPPATEVEIATNVDSREKAKEKNKRKRRRSRRRRRARLGLQPGSNGQPGGTGQFHAGNQDQGGHKQPGSDGQPGGDGQFHAGNQGQGGHVQPGSNGQPGGDGQFHAGSQGLVGHKQPGSDGQPGGDGQFHAGSQAQSGHVQPGSNGQPGGDGQFHAGSQEQGAPLDGGGQLPAGDLDQRVNLDQQNVGAGSDQSTSQSPGLTGKTDPASATQEFFASSNAAELKGTGSKEQGGGDGEGDANSVAAVGSKIQGQSQVGSELGNVELASEGGATGETGSKGAVSSSSLSNGGDDDGTANGLQGVSSTNGQMGQGGQDPSSASNKKNIGESKGVEGDDGKGETISTGTVGGQGGNGGKLPIGSKAKDDKGNQLDSTNTGGEGPGDVEAANEQQSAVDGVKASDGQNDDVPSEAVGGNGVAGGKSAGGDSGTNIHAAGGAQPGVADGAGSAGEGASQAGGLIGRLMQPDTYCVPLGFNRCGSIGSVVPACILSGYVRGCSGTCSCLQHRFLPSRYIA